jgi:hypothetical protein
MTDLSTIARPEPMTGSSRAGDGRVIAGMRTKPGLNGFQTYVFLLSLLLAVTGFGVVYAFHPHAPMYSPSAATHADAPAVVGGHST